MLRLGMNRSILEYVFLGTNSMSPGCRKRILSEIAALLHFLHVDQLRFGPLIVDAAEQVNFRVLRGSIEIRPQSQLPESMWCFHASRTCLACSPGRQQRSMVFRNP